MKINMKVQQSEILSILDEAFSEYLAGLAKLREQVVEKMRKKVRNEGKKKEESA